MTTETLQTIANILSRLIGTNSVSLNSVYICVITSGVTEALKSFYMAEDLLSADSCLLYTSRCV